MAIRLGVAGTLIAIGTIAVAAWGENEYGIGVATTMAFMTASLLHITAAFEWRDPTRSVLRHESIANGRFNLLMLLALAMAFLATTIPALNRMLGTVQLTQDQWSACLIAVVAYFVLAEIGKVVARAVLHD
jgi:Ca2+-transporting ATPase